MVEAITIATFAVVCAVALFRIEWSLALIVLLFPFKQALQASSGFFLTYYYLPNLVVVGIASTSLIRSLATSAAPMRGYLSPMFWSTIVIYAWSAVTLAWTPSYGTASEFVTNNLPYLFLYVFLAPALVDGIESVRKFIRLLLWLSAVVAAVILVNPTFISQSGRMGIKISASLQSNPLAIGELGGMMIIMAVLVRPSSATFTTGAVRLTTFILGVLLGLQSGSRGQMLFSVMLAILFVPIAKRVRNVFGFFGTAAGMAIVGAAVLFLAQGVLEGHGLKRWEADSVQEGIGVRFANAADLLVAWATFPPAWLFGLGLNAFSSLGQVQAYQSYSHNMTIDALAELGLPIFVIFTGIWYRVYRSSVWLVRRFSDDVEYRAVAATLVALVAFEFLLANKQGMLWVTSNLFMWALILNRVRQCEELEMVPNPAREPGEDRGSALPDMP
jgi:hypothetical protein